MVKDVRQALKEIKQYQHDNGIFCTTDIDGYTDFVFLKYIKFGGSTSKVQQISLAWY